MMRFLILLFLLVAVTEVVMGGKDKKEKDKKTTTPGRTTVTPATQPAGLKMFGDIAEDAPTTKKPKKEKEPTVGTTTEGTKKPKKEKGEKESTGKPTGGKTTEGVTQSAGLNLLGGDEGVTFDADKLPGARDFVGQFTPPGGDVPDFGRGGPADDEYETGPKGSATVQGPVKLPGEPGGGPTGGTVPSGGRGTTATITGPSGSATVQGPINIGDGGVPPGGDIDLGAGDDTTPPSGDFVPGGGRRTEPPGIDLPGASDQPLPSGEMTDFGGSDTGAGEPVPGGAQGTDVGTPPEGQAPSGVATTKKPKKDKGKKGSTGKGTGGTTTEGVTTTKKPKKEKGSTQKGPDIEGSAGNQPAPVPGAPQVQPGMPEPPAGGLSPEGQTGPETANIPGAESPSAPEGTCTPYEALFDDGQCYCKDGFVRVVNGGCEEMACTC